jgi:hypothetical protein
MITTVRTIFVSWGHNGIRKQLYNGDKFDPQMMGIGSGQLSPDGRTCHLDELHFSRYMVIADLMTYSQQNYGFCNGYRWKAISGDGHYRNFS